MASTVGAALAEQGLALESPAQIFVRTNTAAPAPETTADHVHGVDDKSQERGRQGSTEEQQQQEEEDAPIVEENWTLEEARRTTVFWMTSFSIGQLSLTGTAFVFHFRTAMRDQDIPDSEVDRLYLLISIASVISRVGGGGRILSVSTHQLVCD